jgi:phage tail-like protein
MVAQPRPIVARTIRMPEVTGILLENAALMLRNAEFPERGIRLRYEEAYRPEDEVIEQDPPPGALVAVDETVTLTVSRRSLLHHLPQVFQKSDRPGRHYLRDFLWIFDHVFADLERRIGHIHRYFDPLETPKEFLPWIAGWVALAIDQEWPEEKKRQLIRQAVELYGYRGTVRGLKLFLSLFTGVEPRIYENKWPYKGFRVGGVRIGMDSIVLSPVNLAHCFMIEIPAAFNEASDETILKIHDIIRMEKPAHTAYHLTFEAVKSKNPLEAFVVGLGRVGVGDARVVDESATPETEGE